MCTDKVANIRFNVAKTLGKLLPLVDATTYRAQIKDVLETMSQDKDADGPRLVVLDGPPCIGVDRLPSCESALSRSGTVNRANCVLDGPGCVDLDNLPSSESRLARVGTVYNNQF